MTDLADERERERKRLYERYDNAAIETGIRIQGDQFLGRLQELDELDPTWAAEWLRHHYGHIYNRRVLDHRTRALVVVGELVVLGRTNVLPIHIKDALQAGAQPEEILEVILQSSTYNGVPAAHAALAVFRRVMRETGAMPLKSYQELALIPDWVLETLGEAPRGADGTVAGA